MNAVQGGVERGGDGAFIACDAINCPHVRCAGTEGKNQSQESIVRTPKSAIMLESPVQGSMRLTPREMLFSAQVPLDSTNAWTSSYGSFALGRSMGMPMNEKVE